MKGYTVYSKTIYSKFVLQTSHCTHVVFGNETLFRPSEHANSQNDTHSSAENPTSTKRLYLLVRGVLLVRLGLSCLILFLRDHKFITIRYTYSDPNFFRKQKGGSN